MMDANGRLSYYPVSPGMDPNALIDLTFLYYILDVFDFIPLEGIV